MLNNVFKWMFIKGSWFLMAFSSSQCVLPEGVFPLSRFADDSLRFVKSAVVAFLLFFWENPYEA